MALLRHNTTDTYSGCMVQKLIQNQRLVYYKEQHNMSYMYLNALKQQCHPLRILFCGCVNLKTLGEFFQVSNFNMASTSGGAHGGSRRNSGRKKRYASQKDYRKVWEGEHKRVYFNQNIFKS